MRIAVASRFLSGDELISCAGGYVPTNAAAGTRVSTRQCYLAAA
jgi:hypothetical protein